VLERRGRSVRAATTCVGVLGAGRARERVGRGLEIVPRRGRKAVERDLVDLRDVFGRGRAETRVPHVRHRRCKGEKNV
jgi:hypothetical protein